MVKTGIDTELETLLQLDGEVFPMDNGFWVKFKVYPTPKNKHIPHGIKYSLTLHDKYNRRIVGYDNAHGINHPKRKNFLGTGKYGIINTGNQRCTHMNLKMRINS